MNHEAEKEIAKLFLNLSEYERKIELIRQNLAEFEEFEPYAAFQRISRLGKGYISQKEISDFLEFITFNSSYSTYIISLRFNGMNSYENDLEFLIRVYDSNDDKKLSYRDFLNFILPHSSPELRQTCTQRQSYGVNFDEILPWEIEFKLAKLIELEISLFNETDSRKNAIVNLSEFNLKDVFACLAGTNSSWIDMSSLGECFTKFNLNFKEHDLFCIIKRIDKDQDGSICYSDFVEFILPIKPYTRLSINSVLNKSSEINNIHKISPTIPNVKLFPAHFRCNSCNQTEINYDNKEKINKSFNFNQYNQLNPELFKTNLTYTQSNRDSFLTPTKNLNLESNKNIYFSTKPIFFNKNKIQINDTAKEYKAYKSYKIPEKQEEFKQSRKNIIKLNEPKILELNNQGRKFGVNSNEYKIVESNFNRKYVAQPNEYNKEESKQNKKFAISTNEDEIEEPNRNKRNVVPSNDYSIHSIEYKNEESNQNRKNFIPSNGYKKVPIENKKLNEKMSSDPPRSILNEEIKVQVKDLFFLEKSIKLYLEELYADFDLDLNQIFKFFDITNKEKIDSKCLELKLKEYDIFISKFEIYCFIEKYDEENKGYLNFSGFSLAFQNKFPFPEKNYQKNVSNSKITRNFEGKLSKVFSLILNFECDCLLLKKLFEKHSKFSFLDFYVEHFKGEILFEEYLEFLKKYNLQKLDELNDN